MTDKKKAREAYDALLQKEKELRLDEAAQAEPARRSESDTHPIVESDTVDATVDATVSRRSVDPNRVTVCQSLSIRTLLVRRVFTTCWSVHLSGLHISISLFGGFVTRFYTPV